MQLEQQTFTLYEAVRDRRTAAGFYVRLAGSQVPCGLPTGTAHAQQCNAVSMLCLVACIAVCIPSSTLQLKRSNLLASSMLLCAQLRRFFCH
jgi:hypothetical protein